MRRYNHRHDAVLKTIYDFLTNHLPPQFQSTADLPDQIYSFPMNITPTECRSDIVVWDNKETMFLIELTVPFETNLEGARERNKLNMLTSSRNADGRAMPPSSQYRSELEDT